MAEAAKSFRYNYGDPVCQKAVGLQPVELQQIDIVLWNRLTAFLKFCTVKQAGVILPLMQPGDRVFL